MVLSCFQVQLARMRKYILLRELRMDTAIDIAFTARQRQQNAEADHEFRSDEIL
jgi:hypothetical protein